MRVRHRLEGSTLPVVVVHSAQDVEERAELCAEPIEASRLIESSRRKGGLPEPLRSRK